MSRVEELLADRERRSAVIKEIARSCAAVTVKANVPGGDKRIKESFLLVRHFTNLALDQFCGKVNFYDGADGFCAIISADGESLKEKAVAIEDGNPAGRYIDIDVILKGGERSLSRGCMRRCYLCGNPAFVCARNGSHTSAELLSALKKGVREYFSGQIGAIIKESLMAELDVEDKFGLVTPTSQGSHRDLNYVLMQKAQNALIPYLVQAFWEGFDFGERENLLERLRPVGLEAESAMYSAAGANAYKGFIFIGGVLLAAIGCVIASNGEFDGIFDAVKKICRGLTAELESGCTTFGAEAYRRFKITGARGHAEKGLYAVQTAERAIDDGISPQSLKKALCLIVGSIEDTVLLKRSRSFQRYEYFKNKISSADADDENAVKALTRECIENGISIGGSADVLAAAVMLKKFRRLLYFERT